MRFRPLSLSVPTSSFVMGSFAIANSALILSSSRDDFIAASVSKNATPSTVYPPSKAPSLPSFVISCGT